MMGIFILYLVKATVCLVVFSLFFRLLLMKETFFRFTRVTLIVGLIICSVLPLVKLEIKQPNMIQRPILRLEKIVASYGTSGETTLVKANEIMETPEEDVLAGSSGEIVLMNSDEMGACEKAGLAVARGEKPIVTERKMFPFFVIIFAVYLLGLLIMCVRLIISLWRLRFLIRNNPVTERDRYRLVICREDIIPFSFFNYIVLSEADYHSNAREIILHEQMHMRYRHNLDILFSELLLMIHWFNPAVWLLHDDLREVHEYEVDNAVIEQGIDAREYQLLLIKKAVGERRFTSVVNSFNQSKIKNRITMMLRKESSAWARLKVLLIVPLTAVLLLAFAQPEMEQQAEIALQQDKPKSVKEQVQENPYFYWEEVQQFCTEKGIRPKDMEVKPGTNQTKRLLIILVNSGNQVMYQSQVSSEVFKSPGEGNSQASIQALKRMIIGSVEINDPDPIYFSFQHDVTASTQFIFTFLESTLPAAYEAALNEISERDNIPVERLRKEKPLLLLHGIPKNYSGDANLREQEGRRKEKFIINVSVTKDGEEKKGLYTAISYGYGKQEDLQTVSIRYEIIPDKSGGDSVMQEQISTISALEPADIALVSVGTDVTITDLNNIKTVLDKKLKLKKSIFVQRL